MSRCMYVLFAGPKGGGGGALLSAPPRPPSSSSSLRLARSLALLFPCEGAADETDEGSRALC